MDWSPDGRRIVYGSNTYKDGEPDKGFQVISTTPDGKESSQLLITLDNSTHDQLSWSPDGKRLIFRNSDDKGYDQIYLANPDGSGLTQLTTDAANHFSPVFSPDGQWIVYTSDKEKNIYIANLFLIHPDGSGEVELTKDTDQWRADPAWSPKGDWIAFSSNMSGNYDIYLIRSDGTGLLKVTQSNADEVFPSWRVVSP